MAHHLQHPSGMPYHIYQNAIKPLTAENVQRTTQISQIATFQPHSATVLLPSRPTINIGHPVNVRGLTASQAGTTLQIKQEPLQASAPSAFITMHPNANVIWPNRYLLIIKTPIDSVSNLVFWSCLANKLDPWHNVYIILQ